MAGASASVLEELNRKFSERLPEILANLQSAMTRAQEAGWTGESVGALHLAVHSLTGSAGTFGFSSISAASERLERLVDAVRRNDAPPAPETQAACRAAFGALAAIVSARHSGVAPSLKRPPRRPAGATEDAPLVYLVDDDEAVRAQLSGALAVEGFTIDEFGDLDSLTAAMRAEDAPRPAAVVIDLMFPEGPEAGAAAVSKLGLARDLNIPIIVVSTRDDLDARLVSFRAGAARYLTKPVDPQRLVDFLDQVTHRLPAQPYRVLLVDDQTETLAWHAALLEEAGMTTRTLEDPFRFIEALTDFAPDVILLDLYMPNVSGPELAAIVRERDETLHTPILFLSAEADQERQLSALNLGGDDFLTKPVRPDHLVAMVTARARRARQATAVRKRLELTLYEREREHLSLARHALVSVTDQAGVILHANDLFCEISGYSRDELIGATHRLLKSGRHPDSFYRDMWRTISEGRIWQGQICNRGKDGSEYWVASTITPFLNAAGKPYQYVSIRTDITAVKRTEDRLREQSAQQRLASEIATLLLAATGESLDDAIQDALGWIGERLGAARGVLLLNLGDEAIREAAHWSADGVDPSHLAPPDDLMASLKDRSVTTLAAEPSGAPARCFVALHKGAEVIGALGFEARPDEAAWVSQEVKGLTLLGDVVAGALVRRDVEAKLVENSERLQRGQRYANIGTWDWNIATGGLYWSERIAPLFGYEDGTLETTYENFLGALHPDDRDQVRTAIENCVVYGAPYDIEHRVVWPDGQVRWLSERGDVLRDAKGRPLRMLGVVQDIHARKIAQLSLAEKEAQLREAQKMAHVGDWMEDLTTDSLHWSEELFAIVGGGPPVGAVSNDFLESLVHPEDRDGFRAMRERLRTGDDEIDHVFRINRRNDEQTRYIHELAAARRDGAGGLIGMRGTMQDVTERFAVQQALIEARDDAEKADRAKSEFLSSMSHELRTPMNAVLGYAQLMQGDETLSEENADNVNEILKSGNHLLELINEVLDLSRIEAGRLSLSLEAVPIADVIAESLTMARALGRPRGIEVESAGVLDQTVRADRTRLKQALLNLLSNAVKYNRDDGRVSLHVEALSAERLRILVRDTGVGVREDRKERLFQPFERLGAEHSSIEGTGIGLTITKKLVDAMGGVLDFESEPGVGSAFWIDLPAAAAMPGPSDADDADARAPAERDGGNEDGGESLLRVLYIEDNPTNLRLMRQIMAKRPDVLLSTAHTPELGLEYALADVPDLILLDINMPNMDGYQVLRILRQEQALRDTPIVALTANARESDVKRGRAAGFAEYLVKPLKLPELNDVLDKVMGGRE